MPIHFFLKKKKTATSASTRTIIIPHFTDFVNTYTKFIFSLLPTTTLHKLLSISETIIIA